MGNIFTNQQYQEIFTIDEVLQASINELETHIINVQTSLNTITNNINIVNKNINTLHDNVSVLNIQYKNTLNNKLHNTTLTNYDEWDYYDLDNIQDINDNILYNTSNKKLKQD